MVTATRSESVQRTTDQLMAEAPSVPVRVQAPVQAEPTLSPRVVQPLSVETPQSAPSAPPAEAVKETAKEVNATAPQVLSQEAPPAYNPLALHPQLTAPPAYQSRYPSLQAPLDDPTKKTELSFPKGLFVFDAEYKRLPNGTHMLVRQGTERAVKEIENLFPEADFDYADSPVKVTPQSVLEILKRTDNPSDPKIQALLPKILLEIVDQCPMNDVSPLVEIATLVKGEGLCFAAMKSASNFERLYKLVKANTETPGTLPIFTDYTGTAPVKPALLEKLVLTKFQHPLYGEHLKQYSDSSERILKFRNEVREYAFFKTDNLELSAAARKIFKLIEPGRYAQFLKDGGKLPEIEVQGLYTRNGEWMYPSGPIPVDNLKKRFSWIMYYVNQCHINLFSDPSIDSYDPRVRKMFNEIAEQLCVTKVRDFYTQLSSLLNVSPQPKDDLDKIIKEWYSSYSLNYESLNRNKTIELARINNERNFSILLGWLKASPDFPSLQQEILRHPHIVEKLRKDPKQYRELCEFCKLPFYVLSEDQGTRTVLNRAMKIVGQISQDDLAKIKLEQAALKK